LVNISLLRNEQSAGKNVAINILLLRRKADESTILMPLKRLSILYLDAAHPAEAAV
jgi:hypothetical protein